MFFEKLDVVFVVIKSRDTEALVGSIYARLSDETNFLDLMGCFNAAKNDRSKNQLRGPIILGGCNARLTAWGDTTSHGYGKILLEFSGSEGFVVSSPYKPVFVKNHVNGGKVIDLCLFDSSVCNLLSEAFVDNEVELFPGASFVGHWPICW